MLSDNILSFWVGGRQCYAQIYIPKVLTDNCKDVRSIWKLNAKQLFGEQK